MSLVGWVRRSLGLERRSRLMIGDPGRLFGEAWAGRIDEVTALGVPALYAGVTLISDLVAIIPAGLYRHEETGWVRASRDPRDQLVTDRVNPWVTSGQFKSLVTKDALLHGAGYALLIEQDDGPIQLEPIPATWISETARLPTGRPVTYQIAWPHGPAELVSASRVFRLPGPSATAWTAHPVLRAAHSLLLTALATEAYTLGWFQTGGRGAGWIYHPGQIAPESRAGMQEAYDQVIAGAPLRYLLLEYGMKAQEVGGPQVAELAAQRQRNTLAIAQLLRIPPPLLGELEKTGLNVEQLALQLVNYTLRPWIERWRQQLNLFLLPYRSPLSFRFDLDPLLVMSAVDRWQAYTRARDSGALSPDEIRDREGLGPIPDGLGRDHYYPANMVPLGAPPERSPQATGGGNGMRDASDHSALDQHDSG